MKTLMEVTSHVFLEQLSSHKTGIPGQPELHSH